MRNLFHRVAPLLALTAAALCASMSHAQERPMRPASQAEVNAGTNSQLAVVPRTLAGLGGVTIRGGTNDDTAGFNAILGTPGAKLELPYRANGYTVGNLYVTNSVTFINRGSIIAYKTNSTGPCISMGDNTNIVLQGLILNGQNATNDFKVLLPADPRLPYNGAKGRIGMNVNMQGNKVTGCTVFGFDGRGYQLRNKDAGSSEVYPLTEFHDNGAFACWIGFDFNALTNSPQDMAEYSLVYGLNASRCAYGLQMGAGNCRIVACNFSGNGVGHFLQGGNNHAHDKIGISSFNHNTYGVFGYFVNAGLIYVGCDLQANTSYDIFLDAVTGVFFESCQFHDSPLVWNTNSSGGSVLTYMNGIRNSTVSIGEFNPATVIVGPEAYFITENIQSMNTNSSSMSMFATPNTGDFRPQFGFGARTILPGFPASITGYEMGRRSADGLVYMAGIQDQTASGFVVQHSRSASTHLGTDMFRVAGNAGGGGVMTVSNSIISVMFLPTNALTAWPTAAPVGGASAIINSNGTLYRLKSAPFSTAWISTNIVN